MTGSEKRVTDAPHPDRAIFGDLTTHGRNCPVGDRPEPMFEFVADCTCSLGYRRRWATAETMSATWRKRAMEAEAALSLSPPQPAEPKADGGWVLVPEWHRDSPTRWSLRALGLEIGVVYYAEDFGWCATWFTAPTTKVAIDKHSEDDAKVALLSAIRPKDTHPPQQQSAEPVARRKKIYGRWAVSIQRLYADDEPLYTRPR